MASMPLSMRFMNTCCTCTRSTMILGSSAERSVRTAIEARLTFQQREHFVDNSVHVDQLTLWRRFLLERTHAVDDLSRAIPILIDSGGCRTGPIKIGRFVCQPFNAAVGAGDRGSDGLLNLVCE
jgi:hypothetical protein